MTMHPPQATSTPPAARSVTEHTMTMADGTELFYRAWLPDRPSGRSLVMFHRGHEHSGRFLDVIEALGLDEDVAIFAWDARGHGRSPGERGYAPGLATVIKDLDTFVRGLGERHGLAVDQMVVLGHSVGAVSLAAWVHDYAPRVRGMVLVTPALRVRLYVPAAIPGLRLLQKLKRGEKAFIKSYVKSRMLTHDPEQARRYDADPLIARAIAVNILLDLYDTATRLIDDAGAIRTPTLLLAGGADWVVDVGAQRTFFDRLGSTTKRIRTFAGMYHDLLHERDREPVLEEIRRFTHAVFQQDLRPAPCLDADHQGYTQAEHDRLSQPLPRLALRRWPFAAQWLAMQTLGRLSAGIRLGWRTGFDSGQSLDYVYTNQPRGGLGPLGRWVDRQYLNAPGWQGIRRRREHLRSLLRQAVERVGQNGEPVRVVDVASGPGRYVLETVKDLDGVALEVTLRDHDPANLEAARRVADELGVPNVRYEQGDAFDEASLARLDPRPDVAVVAGLYELFPDNPRVLASLRGLAQALRPGGCLIYTGQPWHPQIEMIARVLPNRDGAPWIMRRRTQAEMDDLVRAAGFDKLDQLTDERGIFTVSLATRHEHAQEERR